MLNADALFARAIALEDAGRSDEALQHYRQLLDQTSAHADAWHNHGLLLARLGRLAEAEQSHRAYLQAVPDSARARSDLADVLLALGRYHAAIEALDSVIERSPDDAPALVRRGAAYACLRRFSEARSDFSVAMTRSPAAARGFLQRVTPNADAEAMLSPENIFLGRGYMAQGSCDWSGWTGYVAEMRRAAVDANVVVEPAVAFMALHLPLSEAERHAIARGIAARIEAKVPAMPPPTPRRHSRIRIGILSPDYREHLNAYLLLPLFELIDRNRFELHAYSLALDDGSAIRARIRSAAHGFRDLHALPDTDAAMTIRSDDIDILVDVAGHTTGGRVGITLQRPARLQALYLGFPGSLGSDRVDFAIADRLAAANRNEWTESLIDLPSTYYLYDFRTPAPDVAVSRSGYRLPQDSFVYCAFHKAEKITPDAFGLWMEILRRVPHSVLWCLSLPETAKANLLREAAIGGVEPSRLIFAPFDPRERYLARQRLGDLMLDAIHHSAMTTACDAIGGGLPMLTMQGSTMASRAGESLLRAAGLPELVAADREAYVESAVRLAHEPATLRRLRKRLAANRNTAPLFDTAARVRELEACFERMLQVSAHSRSRL